MSDPSCRVQALAEGGPAKIGYCHGCRLYHVQIGYVTLHINPAAFAGLGAAVTAALAIVQRQEAGAEAEGAAAAPGGRSALH